MAIECLKNSLLTLFALCFSVLLIGYSDTEKVVSEQYIVAEDTLNIDVKYPKLSEESDQTNDLVREFAINAFDNGYNFEYENLTINVDYEITTYNNELLSVVFSGSAYAVGSAYPIALCYAITIDLKNECIMNCDSYFKNESEILETINNGYYNVTYGGMKAFTHEEIYQRFLNVFLNESSNEYLYFYVKDDDVYLIIGPLAHVLGDYSIVCIYDETIFLNAQKLETVVSHCYEPKKKAISFAKKLDSVGTGAITEVEVTKQDERVIVVALVDESNHKYCVTLDAKTGYVGVIYENELNGKALYFEVD